MEIYIVIGLLVAVLIGIIALIVLSFKKKDMKNSVSTEFSEEQEEFITERTEAVRSQVKDEAKNTQEKVNIQIMNVNNNLSNTLNENHRNVQLFFDTMSRNLFDTIEKQDARVNSTLADIRRDTLSKLDSQKDDNIRNNKDIRDTLDSKIKGIQDELKESIERIRQGNEKKLDEIKHVVDEQLQDAVQKRISESFAQINKQLGEVQRGLGEMTKLTSGVDNLNKVLSNVKTRGVWGEVSLDNLLSNIMTKEQYQSQVSIKKNKDAVDFAIMMPGKNKGDIVKLPIDAKFPLSDYERLVEASENCDKNAVELAKKSLINRIKDEAKSIKEKYIDPPHTTDFAIMYLPIEGLYAEVAKEVGLLDELQSKFKVVISGPTTLTALLNSLQIGFRTLQVQENSVEIAKILTKFKDNFYRFVDDLNKAKKQVNSVANTIDESIKRTERITKNLGKLDGIELEDNDSNKSYLEEVASDTINE